MAAPAHTGFRILAMLLAVAALCFATPLTATAFDLVPAMTDPEGEEPEPPEDPEDWCVGDPVSPYSGKLTLRHTDLVVPGVFPIRMVRRYDSQARYDPPLGYGWAFTYDTRLYEYPDGSVVMGVPGKIRRQVTEEEMQAMRWRAGHYVDRARSYLDPNPPDPNSSETSSQ